jgi:hypothetical protein
VDATWAAIRGLKALGLATDLQLVPKGAGRFRLDRKETGAAPAILELDRAGADVA